MILLLLTNTTTYDILYCSFLEKLSGKLLPTKLLVFSPANRAYPARNPFPGDLPRKIPLIVTIKWTWQKGTDMAGGDYHSGPFKKLNLPKWEVFCLKTATRQLINLVYYYYINYWIIITSPSRKVLYGKLFCCKYATSFSTPVDSG